MTSDHQEFEQDRPGLISRLCCMQSSPETDPRLFSTGKKTVIMSLVIMCASTGGLYATVCFPGYPAMTDEFNVPSVVTTMVGALYILFGGLALVVWAAISERFCVRRPLLLCGALIVTGASVGLALMTNMAGIVTLRCIQATGTSAYLVLCSGIVADCYPVEKRGTAMSLLFFGIFFGPLFGPIIGGALVATPLSWRATFWFCSAYGLATFILLLFLLPETFRNDIVLDGPPRVDSGIDRLINNNAEEQHIDPPKKSSSSMLAPLLLLQYPHVLLASLVGCIAFSCLFVVETILPELLASRYGFSSWQIGECVIQEDDMKQGIDSRLI
ncbi:hypothetical protein RO3G_09409 [Lichtheimia corymbifera JMRC:FSU:9682]|uniref:Major facilitator superfamily (MFS) profile domain-containing protein n=1 Tax=Lichtheimia corymbifera JMRC:FSU:9682 TaxID=1263082 RepID=A0A068RQV4_9FUNG|nr:hypothetical protein RO3G_09409 [Lichtheimia corymbifera JMRC:FSU:9682]